MKKRRIIILFLVALMMLFSASPVYADTLDPDSDPTIQSFNVYRNLRETGDFLLVIYANIPYTVLPDTSVTETFIWRLLDTDGTTELGSTLGTNYNEDGYGFNVYSMYFTAAEVTALGIVWATAYPVRLSGNPVVFDTPPVYNYSLAAPDYSSETVQADVQSELAARILTISADLTNKWGLAPAVDLLTETEVGTVLSIFGEAFWRGAINGIQSMAPAAFSVIIRVIDVESREWSTNYTDNLTNQWAGTWVETAQEGGKALFGTDYDLLSVIMILLFAGGLMVGNIMLTGDMWNGFADVAVVGVIGARLGMFDFGILMLIAAMAWIYISAKIWFGLIK